MADTDTQHTANSGPTTGAKTRAKVDSAADAATDALKAEQRTFADAGEDMRRTIGKGADQAKAAAQNGLQASRDIAAASQEAMRKASGQAVDLWRSSLDPIANMQTELGRWFEQTWRQGLSGRLRTAPLFGEAMFAALAGAPSSDLYETPEGLELIVELPGMTAEDVQLSLKGDSLIVSGERSDTTTREEGSYRVRERRLGAFQRTFNLPPGANRDNIKAQFDNGVLTVSIPRTAEADIETRAIPIKGQAAAR